MIKAILFDFDGVLGNSKEVILLTFQKVFKKYNLTLPTASDLIPYAGVPMLETIEALLPENHSVDMQEMLVHMREISFGLAKKVRLMSTAKKVVTVLKKQYTLAIVTTRRNITFLTILDQLTIREHFELVIDFDAVKSPKPDTEGILQALEILHLQKDEVVFVGDAKEDVAAVKNAGVISIFFGKENVHNADYHIQSLTKLPGLLQQV